MTSFSDAQRNAINEISRLKGLDQSQREKALDMVRNAKDFERIGKVLQAVTRLAERNAASAVPQPQPQLAFA